MGIESFSGMRSKAEVSVKQAHTVYGNAVGCQFQSQRPCEADGRRFEPGIGDWYAPVGRPPMEAKFMIRP